MIILLDFRKTETDKANAADEQTEPADRGSANKLSTMRAKPQFWAILDGIRLILASTYLLYVALFLWLSAVISSFFYFQVFIYLLNTFVWILCFYTFFRSSGSWGMKWLPVCLIDCSLTTGLSSWVMSSGLPVFFYLQKVTVIASAVTSPIGRRKLFAQINSFIAVFILAGQLSLTVWQYLFSFFPLYKLFI